MGIPALWGAYRVMSESIASLPIEVFERKTDGNYPASDQPVRKLLRIEPNDLYSAYDLKSINVLDLCSTGNYFNRIYRRRNGTIYRIVRIDPSKVTILYDYKNLKIFYEVTDHTHQK
jgi:phage portal protein BeeE